MIRKLMTVFLIVSLTALVACAEDEVEEDLDELVPLEVDFNPVETADVDEVVELKAIVTYGDELVDDAEYVDFEYWLDDDKDNSITVESTNEGDGVYTAEVSFEDDGVYSVYAHTQAKDLHTMPKRLIAVGDAEVTEDDADDHAHIEGFDMQFNELDQVTVDEAVELSVQLQLHDEPLEKADVRFEIWSDSEDDAHEWVEAEEVSNGEYSATHTFKQADDFNVQIHVEDDEDLHEHETHVVNVSS
ncbi:MAG TPA: FixH family protein [Bacillota bacterium]|nr:FixH family protein [Bacillota bacterium]